MNKNRFIIISVFILIATCRAGSQVAFTGQELGSDFTRGMELFNKEKYPAAISCSIHTSARMIIKIS